MKKIVIGFVVITALALNSSTVLAADALYRMLHAEEVEQFKVDQDAIVVGQLIAKVDNKFEVKVLKVISGQLKGNTFWLSDDFKYGYADKTPAVMDYAVMSVKYKGGAYHSAWGIYAADSGDYKTLKLLPENTKYTNWSDLAAIERYVNSGGKENDFFFEREKAFVRKAGGQSIQIYPKLNLEAASSAAADVKEFIPDDKVSENARIELQQMAQTNSPADDKPYVGWIVAAVLIGAVVVITEKMRKASTQR